MAKGDVAYDLRRILNDELDDCERALREGNASMSSLIRNHGQTCSNGRTNG